MKKGFFRISGIACALAIAIAMFTPAAYAEAANDTQFTVTKRCKVPLFRRNCLAYIRQRLREWRPATVLYHRRRKRIYPKRNP